MMIHDCIQGTPEWKQLRLGKPTASGAISLISGRGTLSKVTTMQKYAERLAGEKFMGEEMKAWKGNDYTERGHELEPEARAHHAYELGKPVIEVGFVTDSLMRYGASPDGLIGSPGAWLGGGEYKCLPEKHIEAIMCFDRTGKPPFDYIPQTQQNLLVCELEWIDLVYYHKKLPCKTIRLYRDEPFITKLESQLSLCLEHRDETIEVLKKMKEQD